MLLFGQVKYCGCDVNLSLPLPIRNVLMKRAMGTKLVLVFEMHFLDTISNKGKMDIGEIPSVI